MMRRVAMGGLSTARHTTRLRVTTTTNPFGRAACVRSAVVVNGLAKFRVKTYNNISSDGLTRFTDDLYEVGDLEKEHAVMLRSYKLQPSEIPTSCRAIARCGAGVNNIPVDECTRRGIPVFNTPGSNANAVKELVLCSLFLAARDVSGSINHVNTINTADADYAELSKQVEKDKKMFGGCEIKGKTLGVIGLGNIGGLVAEAALGLGMKVVAYDPALSVEAAWRLSGKEMSRVQSLGPLLKESDFVTLHLPYMEATHHLLDGDKLTMMKKDATLLNFSRGELIDVEALSKLYNTGDLTGKYICDFPHPVLAGSKHAIMIPHLGASTDEAESYSAIMAADQLKSFLCFGSIVNSVNFPTVNLPLSDKLRLCVSNKNEPGVLGGLMQILAAADMNVSSADNKSRGEIAYNVIDFEKTYGDFSDAFLEEKGMEIARLNNVIACRWVNGPPGTHLYLSP